MAQDALRAGSGTDLISIQREIDRTREELACAVLDLEAAARRVVEPRAWLAAADRVWRRRPGTILLVAAVGGYVMARRAPR